MAKRAARALSAAVTVAAFLAACTRQEVRPPVEVRHFSVDWEHVGAPPVEAQGLRARGVLLTPTQWPLEGSLKRLVKGDFLGVIDAFDLRFHSSSIPTGVLEDLYDRGFVPAYVRMENPSAETRLFTPEELVVRYASGGELEAASPDDLPRTFTRVDMQRTLLAAATVALIVVVIASGRDRGGSLDAVNMVAHSSGRVYFEAGTEVPLGPGPSSAEAPAGAIGPAPLSDRSLLRAQALAPGEAREGVILFIHRGALVDWSSAHLAWH